MRQGEIERSLGHVGFYTYDGVTVEVYADDVGDLWRAPVSNVKDVRTGRRIGRWEAPAWMAEQAARDLLKPNAEG